MIFHYNRQCVAPDFVLDPVKDAPPGAISDIVALFTVEKNGTVAGTATRCVPSDT